MTAPDRIRPAKAQSPTTVGGYLQGVDPAGEGAQNNLWLTQQLEFFRTNLISGILSGFQNIGGAVDQAISAISLALSGAPGGLEALETWAEGLPIFGDALELITGKPDADPNDFASYMLGLVKALRGVDPGEEWGVLQLVFGQQQQTKAAAAAAQAQANIALTAAQNAEGKITALLQGGVRTIATSNGTWVKQPATAGTLIKLIVIGYGGGRRGQQGPFDAQGGAPGGLVMAELSADILPATVAYTIGAGSAFDTPSPTKFGAFLDSGNSLGGRQQDSTLFALAASVFPGRGGNAGGSSAVNGFPGGSTALADGGLAGIYTDENGKAGGNAAVTGQFVAGGAGGGGGCSSGNSFGVIGFGGAGGFPGGGGGGAGRNPQDASRVGGAGAPGMLAIIEYRSAAA